MLSARPVTPVLAPCTVPPDKQWVSPVTPQTLLCAGHCQQNIAKKMLVAVAHATCQSPGLLLLYLPHHAVLLLDTALSLLLC